MNPNRSMNALVIPILLQPCVYGWRRGSIYIYIGKSIHGVARFAWHHTIDLNEIEDGDMIDFWYPSDGNILKLEHQLILKFNPQLNINKGQGRRTKYTDIKYKPGDRCPQRRHKAPYKVPFYK